MIPSLSVRATRELIHRRLGNGSVARQHSRDRLHHGRQRVPERHAGRLQHVLRADLGRHKARTRPSPGNHEYNTPGAAGYFAYFGALAGPSDRGYYSYDLGNWHVVSLNSEISMVAGSAQETWLRSDLAASAKPCTLAYWHKPLFTSSAHPGNRRRGRCSRPCTTTTQKWWSPATTTFTNGSRR